MSRYPSFLPDLPAGTHTHYKMVRLRGAKESQEGSNQSIDYGYRLSFSEGWIIC
jgi:hypothetical protein